VHQRKHKQEFIYKCQEKRCKKQFTDLASLRYHEKKHKRILNLQDKEEEENKNRFYECKHKNCNKKFKSLKDFRNHHNRYAPYCALDKHDLKSALGKTKAKLKQMRKQNQVLRKALKEQGIDPAKLLKKEKKEEKEGPEEPDLDEHFGKDEDEFDAFFKTDF